MSHSTIISMDEAESLIAACRCRVFDCSFDLADPQKGRQIHATAHLPGARYLDLDDDLAGPPNGANGRHPLPAPAAFAAKLQREGLNRDDQVIAYDNAGGPFAARLWWLLRWLGHGKVAVMDGNVTDWEAAGKPIEQGAAPAGDGGNFEARDVRQDAIVDATFVLDNIGTQRALVLDARSGPRYRGEVLIMDTVAGHIPGARNRPFADNLGADGHFKSAEILRDEFSEAIKDFAPADVILQCGSGVTACHNALAMHHAGLTGARLYPGSWSEWVSDPKRPVALGDSSAT